MSRKLQNNLLSGAFAFMTGFVVTSFMHSQLDWMKNHRAISSMTAGVSIVMFVSMKFALDRRGVPIIKIKQAIVGDLSSELENTPLTEAEKEAFYQVRAVYQCKVDLMQKESKAQVTTLNQLF